MLPTLGHHSPHKVFTSDASGCAAYCEQEWFAYPWEGTWSGVHITMKELLPIVMACAVWGKSWGGQRILARCDNAAVVAIMNSGTSKHPFAMHLMRSLFFIAACFHFTISATHIPGVDNVAADALSRIEFSRFFRQVPQAHHTPTPLPPELTQLLVTNWTSSSWRTQFNTNFAKGLAESTLRSYKSRKDRYVRFCTQSASCPLPVSESNLCLFVSHLADQGLKHHTIKCYLSAVRHLQIAEGFKDPFNGVNMPKLDYVMRGVKDQEKPSTEGRLPITQPILHKLREVWQADYEGVKGDTSMLWAACSLAFFGLLRVGELTSPNKKDYDSQVHLNLSDISFNHSASPSLMFVKIKQSKTDPFRQGVSLTFATQTYAQWHPWWPTWYIVAPETVHCSSSAMADI